MFQLARLSFVVAFAMGPALLAACGGSTAPVADEDGGPADGAATGEASTETGATPGDAAVEAATDAAMGPPACSTKGLKACEACCENRQPEGFATLLKAALSCACAADLCGGAPDAGGGACASTCAEKATPDTACAACAEGTIRPDGGACYAEAKTACEADPGCVAFVACHDTCM
jgi:hypothetical protein